MKFPDFIIIGETKCGTSSFYEDLVKHPNINISKGTGDTLNYENSNILLGQKEIRFFDRHWRKGLDWYKDRFKDEKDKITGEASPTYMYRTLSMRRIQKHIPNVKLIIMLRNPIDRVFSHFHHIKRIIKKWNTRYPTFETFIDTAHENDYYIIDKGIYATAIQRCYQMFKPKQIHIIRSEDFFKNPIDTYSETLNFLEIDNYTPLEFSHLRKSGFKSPLKTDTRKYLYNFYKPYNEELYKLINRNMGWFN